MNNKTLLELQTAIQAWGLELGFQQIGVTDVDLSAYEEKFHAWIAKGFHGKMTYMVKHGKKRTKPHELIPGTIRIISARMNYLPPDAAIPRILNDPKKAYLSRYALGRDYHRLMRKRLELLAQKITQKVDKWGYRVFTDSAPVLEKPIAEKAGLGWIGKHTNLINPKAGSWFFLGEIFTDLPLLLNSPTEKSHCGSCHACIDVCPTKAIVAPYQLDARRCISYFTIELRESIPVDLRPLMGNRIYGCDDCQFVCPWNKFAKVTTEVDFYSRHELHASNLLALFNWTEETFLKKTEGSSIRRIGYECWLRNLAVAIGNAPFEPQMVEALRARLTYPSTLVKEHVEWALMEQNKKKK